MDNLGNMLAVINNACKIRKEVVTVPSSTFKHDVANVLVKEGYVKKCEVTADGVKKNLVIVLKYTPEGEPVIKGLKRISTPGRRMYAGCEDIPKVRSGLGHMLVSTSEGVMTDKDARRKRLGGELLLKIW